MHLLIAFALRIGAVEVVHEIGPSLVRERKRRTSGHRGNFLGRSEDIGVRNQDALLNFFDGHREGDKCCRSALQLLMPLPELGLRLVGEVGEEILHEPARNLGSFGSSGSCVFAPIIDVQINGELDGIVNRCPVPVTLRELQVDDPTRTVGGRTI